MVKVQKNYFDVVFENYVVEVQWKDNIFKFVQQLNLKLVVDLIRVEVEFVEVRFWNKGLQVFMEVYFKDVRQVLVKQLQFLRSEIKILELECLLVDKDV